MRELLDVEGIEGVGSYKKITSSASSKSRSVSPNDKKPMTSPPVRQSNGSAAESSNSPIHSTKKLLNNGAGKSASFKQTSPAGGETSNSSSSSSSGGSSESKISDANRAASSLFQGAPTRGRTNTFEENGCLIMVGGQGRLSQESMEQLLGGLLASSQYATNFNLNFDLRQCAAR
jgi:hypothetical protein